MTASQHVYDRFLQHADVVTWRACAQEAARLVEQLLEGDEQAEALAKALCVNMYLEWLGRVSGDLPAQEEAGQRRRDLQAVLERGSASGSAPALSTCWGLLLAWTGYQALGAALLERGGDIPPEHLALVVPDDAVKTMAALRPLFAGPTPCRFLPIVHTYGTALVNAGAVREAGALVEDGSWDPSEPLLLDIQASASERLGQWQEAYDAYRRSSWPNHRLRAAMVGAIVGQEDKLELDEPLRRLVGESNGELDQREVTRSMAFLNACMWQPVDDWVVELELGKLNFGRRRYAEADLHLRRALARAPEGARFGVAQLRFFNLTWLSGDQPQSGLTMTPEALSAGQEALDLSTADDDDTAETRIWMANEVNDLALLPDSLAEWAPQLRADAYEAVEDTARAVDGWLENLGARYNHRSAWRLITYLVDAGFKRTSTHLAEVVMRESRDDFFALWETAQGLQLLSSDAPDAGGGDGSDQPFDRYRRRLIELSQLEFKNTVRSYELVVRAGHQDLAEELLVRAARQAESVSELLAVAVLRRRVQSARAIQDDQEGLWCLARALSEARDRLERLQIARELFHYGRIRDARGILRDEGVFAHDTSLSHIELVAAVQCGPWLTPDERDGLIRRATRRLALDHRTGALGKYALAYRDRLVDTVQDFDRPRGDQAGVELDDLLAGAASGSAWPGAGDDSWPSIRERMDQALSSQDGEAPIELDALRGADDPASSFGLRLMFTASLRSHLRSLLDTLRRVTPSVPAEETPISKLYDWGNGVRAIELCDLWRARITGSNGGAQPIEARFQVFLKSEQVLLDQWERSRREASVPTLHAIARVADAVAASLETLLGPAERDQVHPVVRAIFEHIAMDVEALVSEAVEEARLARLELTLADHPAENARPP